MGIYIFLVINSSKVYNGSGIIAKMQIFRANPMLHIKENLKHHEPLVKEWFIIIGNHQEGPYSVKDLKLDPRITPDTLVWKKGFKEWIPARFVAELEQIFKDEPEGKALHEKPRATNNFELGQEQAALTLRQDPYPFLLWFLLIILILFYAFYQFNK